MNRKKSPLLFLVSVLASFFVVMVGFWGWSALKRGQLPRQRVSAVVNTPAHPHLKLEPDIVVWGQTIQINGTNFCDPDLCTPVTLKIEERVLKDNVKVVSGRIHELIKIEPPTRIREAYLVSAQQTNKKTQAVTETVAEIVIENNLK